ncbi:MAG TPA: protein kinase, partial [Aggregatilineales bacterium]|nr:protein kinase [Aggregatilineales bacterium]
MMSNQSKDELIGKTLGQYVVIEEIGRGGMATVYRAQQPSVNRIVALKVLPRTFLHDPSFFERFTREVAVISQLEHPHILPVHDYGQVNGIPYIVMRYLGGGSLEGRIRKGLPNLAELE